MNFAKARRTILRVCQCGIHLSICINEAARIEIVRIGSLEDNVSQGMSFGEHTTHIDRLFTVHAPKQASQIPLLEKMIWDIIPHIGKTHCSLRDENSVIPIILKVLASIK